MTSPDLVGPVSAWFDEHRRGLPWRAPDRTAWGVLVSEVMLQQTPVARVVPAWSAWLQRWPGPAALAADEPGEAVRQWGRLGYPRRALNLHRAAGVLVDRHGGEVPDDEVALRALPGVGDYTAAAVVAFAFGRRSVVLDTNVRRVLARLLDGVPLPGRSITVAERARAAHLLPVDDGAAAAWSAAVMELGALVCTAGAPRCDSCPVAGSCRWLAAGRPAPRDPVRVPQRFAGTDRQVRGLLLAVLRDSAAPVPRARLDAVWADPVQRARALDGLVADGLVEPLARGRFRLPRRPAQEAGASRGSA